MKTPILAVLAGVLSGCITTPASETGFTARARHAVPKACGEDALVEDGEDGDTRVLQRQGRGGYWYTFVDPEGTTVQPNPFTMSSPGYGGSKGAPRMHGQTAGSGWSIYGGIAFALTDPKGAFDASRYKGISFWAKGPAHIRFEVPDAYTSPGTGGCKDCYNDFGIELMLTERWERYTIPFAWLSQRPGWGEPRPQIAADKLYAMEWQFGTPGRSFEVWLDDVQFICGWESP